MALLHVNSQVKIGFSIKTSNIHSITSITKSTLFTYSDSACQLINHNYVITHWASKLLYFVRANLIYSRGTMYKVDNNYIHTLLCRHVSFLPRFIVLKQKAGGGREVITQLNLFTNCK